MLCCVLKEDLIELEGLQRCVLVTWPCLMPVNTLLSTVRLCFHHCSARLPAQRAAQRAAQPPGLLWPSICFLSGKSLCVLVKFNSGMSVCYLWPFVSSVLPWWNSLPLFYLLQIRHTFSKPEVLEGTNNKPPGIGVTFHNGCSVLLFPLGTY